MMAPTHIASTMNRSKLRFPSKNWVNTNHCGWAVSHHKRTHQTKPQLGYDDSSLGELLSLKYVFRNVCTC